MTKTNAELCARIAALDPEWYRDLPGVAVRDDRTGRQWRFLGVRWVLESSEDYMTWRFKPDVERKLAAAGPDWTDPVTVNALLGDGGVVCKWSEDGEVLWDAWLTTWVRHANRTTAILLAKLANLGG